MRYNDDFPGTRLNGNQEQNSLHASCAEEKYNEEAPDSHSNSASQRSPHIAVRTVTGEPAAVESRNAAPTVHFAVALPDGAGTCAGPVRGELRAGDR